MTATTQGPPRPHISVVVPVYGCESCLNDLYARLITALLTITPSFEIVLVNDASLLGDWRVIEALAAKDPRVRGVNLSRNFGQHVALAAGLDRANGDWVVIMDCDLQDRPEELPKLYERVTRGDCQGVFGRRVVRKDAWSKRWASRLFYATFGYFVGLKTDPTVGNFSMIARTLVLNLRRFHETTRNYPLNVHWMGFDLAYVDVEHAPRHSGKSTYAFSKLVWFALETLLFQSNKPLVISTSVGFLVALGALAYGVFLMVRYFVRGVAVEGWTSVMVSLYFLAGLTFIILGVMGRYIGGIFLEVKGRPLYVVKGTTDEPQDGAGG